MGFLEDLRRQKAVEEARLKDIYLRNERANKVWEEQRARFVRRAIEAKKQFDESGLRILIIQLSELKPIEFEIHEIHEDHPEFSFDDYHLLKVTLPTVEVYDSPGRIDSRMTRTFRFFQIVTSPDGTIKFNGGIEGSSIVSKNLWRNNKSIIEESLGRVYENPQIQIQVFKGGYNTGRDSW